jgi:NhaP-type Na+/H+ or K+/H+ antiporter
LYLWETIFFFFHMIIVAVITGLIFGFIAVALIGMCTEDKKPLDSMMQVAITLCCAYLAFFISESEFSSSGVVATVVAGLVIAHNAWPLFICRDTIRTVWEAIEFIGNTVIFFLAGLIFVGLLLERKSEFGWLDMLWLIVLYFAIFLIRAVMVLVLWIPLNMVGSQLCWQEGVVMAWSGVRGAVSVALAMIVDIEYGIDHKIGSQVMFHVCGIAFLTLIINSGTTPHLLRTLGLIKTDMMMSRIGHNLKARVVRLVGSAFERQLDNATDARFFGANAAVVQAMVPALNENLPVETVEDEKPIEPRMHAGTSSEFRLALLYRETFLRVVQCRYWDGMKDGILARDLNTCSVLLHSTEEALDNTSRSLHDWEITARSINRDESSIWGRFISKSPEHRLTLKIYIALCYIEAHTFAQAELLSNMGNGSAMDLQVQKQVINESNLQKQKAYDLIYSLPSQSVEMAKSDMLARKLLRQHMSEIERMLHLGLLTRVEADHLSKPCLLALRKISTSPQDVWVARRLNMSGQGLAREYSMGHSNASSATSIHGGIPPSYRLASIGAPGVGTATFGNQTSFADKQAVDDKLGLYHVTHDGLPVNKAEDRGSTEVAVLSAGTHVSVLQFGGYDDGSKRARIDAPAGWISIRTVDGKRFVEKVPQV